MGKKPYFDRVVIGGQRPKIDPLWPIAFATLLKACWNEDKSIRPNFGKILKELDLLIKAEEEIQLQKESLLINRILSFLSSICLVSRPILLLVVLIIFITALIILIAKNDTVVGSILGMISSFIIYAILMSYLKIWPMNMGFQNFGGNSGGGRGRGGGANSQGMKQGRKSRQFRTNSLDMMEHLKRRNSQTNSIDGGGIPGGDGGLTDGKSGEENTLMNRRHSSITTNASTSLGDGNPRNSSITSLSMIQEDDNRPGGSYYPSSDASNTSSAIIHEDDMEFQPIKGSSGLNSNSGNRSNLIETNYSFNPLNRHFNNNGNGNNNTNSGSKKSNRQ
jgi:hypothetical protein